MTEQDSVSYINYYNETTPFIKEIRSALTNKKKTSVKMPQELEK